MAVALMADIHGNLEALEACLAHARGLSIGRLVFLGDYVGYGADPEAVTQRIMREVAAGAIAIAGNHDAAVADPSIAMNETAARAIAWTRENLSPSAQAFLAGLPLTVEDDGRLYVHGDAAAPARWNYVLDSEDAGRSLAATRCTIIFCAHVHEPALYSLSMTGKMTCFTPVAGAAIPLMVQRRWLVVLGSVGQPRDGNPAASLCLLDEEKSEITFARVPYDIDKAAAKIRKAGLPESLARRLKAGR